MLSATSLAREAALLEFATQHSSVRLLAPLTIGGSQLAGCSVVRGVLLSPAGAPVGAVKFGRAGVTVTDTRGAVVCTLDRYGCGPSGCLLEHPLHKGTAWAELLARSGAAVRPSKPTAGGVDPARGRGVPGPAAGSPARGESDAPGPSTSSGLGRVAAVGVGLLTLGLLGAIVVGGTWFATSRLPAAAEPDETSAGAGNTAPGARGTTTIPQAPAAPAETLADRNSVAAPTSAVGGGAEAPSTLSDPPPANAAPPPAGGGGSAGGGLTQAGLVQTEATASKEPPAGWAAERPKAPTVAASRASGEYAVRRGDSLYALAQDQGMRRNLEISGWIEECMRLNGIEDANLIAPGQSLRLPSANPAPTWQGDLYSVDRYHGPR